MYFKDTSDSRIDFPVISTTKNDDELTALFTCAQPSDDDAGPLYSTIPEHNAFILSRLQQKRALPGAGPSTTTASSRALCCVGPRDSLLNAIRLSTAECHYELISDTTPFSAQVAEQLAASIASSAHALGVSHACIHTYVLKDVTCEQLGDVSSDEDVPHVLPSGYAPLASADDSDDDESSDDATVDAYQPLATVPAPFSCEIAVHSFDVL